MTQQMTADLRKAFADLFSDAWIQRNYPDVESGKRRKTEERTGSQLVGVKRNLEPEKYPNAATANEKISKEDFLLARWNPRDGWFELPAVSSLSKNITQDKMAQPLTKKAKTMPKPTPSTANATADVRILDGRHKAQENDAFVPLRRNTRPAKVPSHTRSKPRSKPSCISPKTAIAKEETSREDSRLARPNSFKGWFGTQPVSSLSKNIRQANTAQPHPIASDSTEASQSERFERPSKQPPTKKAKMTPKPTPSNTNGTAVAVRKRNGQQKARANGASVAPRQNTRPAEVLSHPGSLPFID